MSAHPWHKRYHSDALTGYASLTLEQRGAYTTILDMLYDSGDQGIPDLDRRMAGILLVTVGKWQRIRQELIDAGKLQIDGGLITNARYLRELERANRISAKRAEAGREGGKAKAIAKQMLENDDAADEGDNGSSAQKTSEKRAKSEQKPSKSDAPAEQVAPAKPAENGETDLANAKLLPRHTRATPEARSQSLTPSSSDSIAEDAQKNDDDDENSIAFPTELLARVNLLARKAGLNVTVPSKLVAAIEMLKSWTDEGMDFGSVVVPTIERVTRENPTETIYSLKYFDGAVRKAAALAGDSKAAKPRPPAPPKAPIALEDGPEEVLGKFRRQLAYSIGEDRYSAKYAAEHVAVRLIDGKFVEMVFRSAAEERVANMDQQAIETTASRLGLMLQTRSL